MKIVLATQNPGKIGEFKELAKGTQINFIKLEDEELCFPEESGTSFRENAFIKAKFIFKSLQIPVLADDSGLEVDFLEGKPGIHRPLMEDLATGRMSFAQVAQIIIHSVKDSETGETHSAGLVKSIVQEELGDILKIRAEQFGSEYPTEYYTKAAKITLQWIKSYTELDFRSLGSYSREDLETIANSPDAL